MAKHKVIGDKKKAKNRKLRKKLSEVDLSKKDEALVQLKNILEEVLQD